MIYVLIIISLILLQASNYSDTIMNFLGSGFLIVTGALNPVEAKFNIPEMIVFIIAVVLLTWIMMNLLVAIYTDAFETVDNYKDIYKYRSKAKMAYEIEMMINMCPDYVKRIFSCKGSDPENVKNNSQNVNNDRVRYSELSYLYVANEKVLKEEKDPFLAKISKAKLDIGSTIEVIDQTKRNVNQISIFNKKMKKKLYKIDTKKQNKEKDQEEDKTDINVLAINLFEKLINDSLEPNYDYGYERIQEIAKMLKKIVKAN
jgi:hypothetical protein